MWPRLAASAAVRAAARAARRPSLTSGTCYNPQVCLSISVFPSHLPKIERRRAASFWSLLSTAYFSSIVFVVVVVINVAERLFLLLFSASCSTFRNLFWHFCSVDPAVMQHTWWWCWCQICVLRSLKFVRAVSGACFLLSYFSAASSVPFSSMRALWLVGDFGPVMV